MMRPGGRSGCRAELTTWASLLVPRCQPPQYYSQLFSDASSKTLKFLDGLSSLNYLEQMVKKEPCVSILLVCCNHIVHLKKKKKKHKYINGLCFVLVVTARLDQSDLGWCSDVPLIGTPSFCLPPFTPPSSSLIWGIRQETIVRCFIDKNYIYLGNNLETLRCT